jgi:non-canonical purine NTP pyrophosphatase (RdgB/HAM1 family)
MKSLVLVTGNEGKLREWQRLLPSSIHLEPFDHDLPEIQSLDLEAIVSDKARRAFAEVGRPVVVEDISAGLIELNGLPGPFIKYFEKQLGNDALHVLASSESAEAIVTCLIGYCDGKNDFTVRAEISGTAVSARGDNGFGFDKCFMPKGQTKTYGQMTPQEKDAISHRAKGISLFVKRLNELQL